MAGRWHWAGTSLGMKKGLEEVTQRDLPAVVILSLLAVVLAWWNWKTRMLEYDLCPYILSVDSFVKEGIIPYKGVLGSLASFTGPASAFLLLPGYALFQDPRLFELPASVMLYLGTVLGVYLIGREIYGRIGGIIGALLFALSIDGLYWATIFWARGHPFFYVCMVYFAIRWIQTDRPGYFYFCLITFIAGIYVHLEIAPAVIGIIVLYLVYKPRIDIKTILVIGIVGFEDLISQVFNKHLLPEGGSVSMTTSQGEAFSWQGAMIDFFLAVDRMAEKIIGKFKNIDANFLSATGNPIWGYFLIVLSLLPLVLVLSDKDGVDDSGYRAKVLRKWLFVVGIGMVMIALVCNELLLGWLLTPRGILSDGVEQKVRMYEFTIFLTGMMFLSYRLIFRMFRYLHHRTGKEFEDMRKNKAFGALLICVFVSWFVLLLLAEPSRGNRFMWLWPLQLVMVIFSAKYLARIVYSGGHKHILETLVLVLICSVILPRGAVASLGAVSDSKLSGDNNPAIITADNLAYEIKKSGNTESAIGCLIYYKGYEEAFSVKDSRYKVGLHFDTYLRFRHGIANSVRKAKGYSDSDGFRIVETAPGWGRSLRHNADMTGFILLSHVGPYQLYGRAQTYSNMTVKKSENRR